VSAPNIHDRARQLVAQSPAPLSLSEAYARLAKRRKHYGHTRVKRQEFAAVESQTRYAWQNRAELA